MLNELFGLFVTELQYSNCLGYYLANNVGGTTILTNFNYMFKIKDYICAISMNSVQSCKHKAISFFLFQSSVKMTVLRTQNYLTYFVHVYELSYLNALTAIVLHIRILVLTMSFNNIM